jgi:HAD superfamily hydrolase (TIGR01484 family)
MTDFDGTLTSDDDEVHAPVLEAISQLEKNGIAVGLVSGRAMLELERFASGLGICGPLIGENGGVAKLKMGGELLNMGYSQEPAAIALEKLKELFPGSITEREDNAYRMVDLVFRSQGVSVEELRSHLDEAELLDSGYILHLMQKGISKGKTLLKVLDSMEGVKLFNEEILVTGDSYTDITLFELFPNSVLIINPRISINEREVLQKIATYSSEQSFGEGFVEVITHILNVREPD